MTLEDLARRRPYARPPAVPDWTLGAFRRRSITFATGAEDATTQVFWLQSHGLTADIRVPKTRPALAGRQSLFDCSRGELAQLARGEGFVAETGFADGRMNWSAFAAFQPYDKWPEPGILGRVGTSLIEWAPSGVYVEDWRLLPRCAGLCVGLRLKSETGLDGVERPRDGGLVISGDHAILVTGRRTPLPSQKGHDLIAAAADPKAAAKTLFDCTVAYALRQDDGAYRIVLAVDPFANGEVLFGPDAFEPGAREDELVQRPAAHETFSLRRWSIDSLLADQRRPRGTPATAEGLAWLEGEKDTLIA